MKQKKTWNEIAKVEMLNCEETKIPIVSLEWYSEAISWTVVNFLGVKHFLVAKLISFTSSSLCGFSEFVQLALSFWGLMPLHLSPFFKYIYLLAKKKQKWQKFQ